MAETNENKTIESVPDMTRQAVVQADVPAEDEKEAAEDSPSKAADNLPVTVQEVPPAQEPLEKAGDIDLIPVIRKPAVPETIPEARPLPEKAPVHPVCAAPDPVRPAPKALSDEAVTGHTAGLWKYQPVPASEPEPAPEYINHVYHFPRSEVIAARVRGKKHKHEGTNCDDWYEVAGYEDITFIAVSDGAGSRKFSRIGARESCKAAVGYLVRMFEGTFAARPGLRDNMKLELSDARGMEACAVLAGIVQQSVQKAYEAVETAYYSRAADPAYAKVLKRNLEFRDLSGTLLLVVLIPVSGTGNEHLVISCQIGDGMIALLNTRGGFSTSLKLMGVPDSGDFTGETEFLTSSQMKNIETLQSRTKISRTSVDTVLVMSDGVADDYFPNETQMRRLYYDLVVNGIIGEKNQGFSLSSATQQQVRLLKRIPDPLAYPWVNDQSVMVAIQYTKRICEYTGLSLEDIWNDPTVLRLARMELEGNNQPDDLSERLKVWLDNYVERGSFDDRTLVVARM